MTWGFKVRLSSHFCFITNHVLWCHLCKRKTSHLSSSSSKSLLICFHLLTEVSGSSTIDCRSTVVIQDLDSCCWVPWVVCLHTPDPPPPTERKWCWCSVQLFPHVQSSWHPQSNKSRCLDESEKHLSLWLCDTVRIGSVLSLVHWTLYFDVLLLLHETCSNSTNTTSLLQDQNKSLELL